jgi:hypothetical protein
MATIAPTVLDVSKKQNGGCLLVTWASIANADTVTPIDMAEYGDKSVQVDGTFGGTSVGLQGSNDGTNYYALRDPSSTAIAITAAGSKAVLENTRYVKPVLTGGAASTITVTLLCRLAQPLRT